MAPAAEFQDRMVQAGRYHFFYIYEPPRPLEVVAADIKQLERAVLRMLADVTGSAEEGS